MKKMGFLGILAIILFAVLVIANSAEAKAATVASGTCGENLTWTLDDQGTLTISGTGEMECWMPYIAWDGPGYFPPWYYSIASINKVVINENVTSIGHYAFIECENLTSVSIPNTVTYIGYGAFDWCTSLQEMTIPNSVTCIYDEAFHGCTSLQSVTIPERVTTIGSAVFSGCESLTAIVVHSQNPNYSSDARGVLFDKNKTTLIVAPSAIKGTYTVPDTVTTIGNSAFGDCHNLTSVAFGNGVTTIGGYAFAWCDELTSVALPVGVTTISSNAFYGCDKLQTVIYCGTEAQWNKISIGLSNTSLTSAMRQYHKYTPATCTTPETCVYCGAAIENTLVAHSYVNGTCTVCGAAQNNLLKINVCRMILENALEFQFGVEKTKVSDPSDYFAIIEKEWADGTVTTKIIPGSQWTSAGQYWAVSYTGIAAKEMADDFHVTIYHTTEGQVFETYTASVRSYAMDKMDRDDMVFKTMLVDMLRYGAAAQKNFGYNTGDLADNQLTAEQLSWGSQTKAMENYQVKGEFYQGTRLVLESRIQMQIGFSGLKSGMYAVYTYTNHHGNEISQRVEFEDMIAVGDGIYGVSMDTLVVADARQLITVIVYTADGQVYGGAVDSIESYCKRSSVFTPLSLDLMRFSDSAYAYFHQ